MVRASLARLRPGEPTPVGAVLIERAKLAHIVEKRQDARERYTRHALATMQDPWEVWLVEYEDGEGNAKALNRHRHGECVYQRP